MDPLLQIAHELAARYHRDQVDKAGQPYVMHLLRVSAAGTDLNQQVLGAIHDLLEDTQVQVEYLRTLFSDDVMTALSAVTRETGESYRAYITRVGKNPLAKAVKTNDLFDNLSRLHHLPVAEAIPLYKRYSEALVQLWG